LNHQSHTMKSILSACIEKNLSFAIFSYPGTTEIELIIENPTSNHHQQAGFILRPFELSNEHPEVFIPADFHLNSGSDWTKYVVKILALPRIKKSHNAPKIHFTDKDRYLVDLEKGILSMPTLKVDKFIYSRIEKVDTTDDLDRAKLFFQVIENQKTAFVYLVNHPQSGMWMGATPETLTSWKGGTISTMSLAGTQPDLGGLPLWEQKEKEEQDYVTKYIETCFSKNRIPYQTEETKSIKAGPVYHLQNAISSLGKVSFIQALHLTQSMHPTPAICGVPLPRAKNLIRALEKHERAYYTGYLGFINPHKEVQLFVNLRCMQILSNYVALYLGGGITSKSVAEKEWEETVLKSQTLLNELESLSAK